MYYRYYFLCCNSPKNNIENYLQAVKNSPKTDELKQTAGTSKNGDRS